MKIFNVDAHISVIADIRRYLEWDGHDVTSLNVSDHCFVFGGKPTNIPYLRDPQWKSLDVSGAIDTFTKEYGAQIRQHDVVLTTHPPLFSQLFRNFDKPQIVVCSIRFDYGVHRDAARFKAFVEFLQRKNIYLIANSLYDRAYLGNWVQKEILFIPNICSYTNAPYNRDTNSILYYHPHRLPVLEQMKLIWRGTIPAGHKWSDISGYRAVVHIPYQVSTMSLFEHYWMGIPMFIPSQKFLFELYCKGEALQHYSTQRMELLASQSIVPGKCEFDPNNYQDKKSVMHWLQLADYYQPDWANVVQYFDSFEMLQQMLRDYTDRQLDDISRRMRLQAQAKEMEAARAWHEVMQTVEGGMRQVCS